MARFVRWYGSNPLHLLVPICSFALTAYGMVRLFAIRPLAVAVWFVGAAIVHDLVLLPRWPIITGVLFGASAVAYAQTASVAPCGPYRRARAQSGPQQGS
ncbi:hypothetical protein ACFYYI_12515 [Streptomyces sp. NPDC002387]|uniref:hypothetical protein n=1 Tax=unclassified Streptomyces TaxID=2593676 RepID=UPI0036CCA693